jgi:hypothetical protein
MDAAETSDGHLVVSEEDVPEHLRISLSELHEEEVIGHVARLRSKIFSTSKTPAASNPSRRSSRF